MTTQSETVGTPPLDASPDVQVDWLEFVAFFNRRGVARLDRLDGALTIQEEDHLADDGASDAILDDRRALIEDEVEQRTKALGAAYPFVMSDDGEELRIRVLNMRGAGFYFLCLIVSHFKYSTILLSLPSDKDVARVRKEQFQLLATLAVAGAIRGPAISMGWPRSSGETILDVLNRMAAMGSTGIPRPVPGSEASPSAKDGGIDVIGWTNGINRLPPPLTMYFGQVASGHNWRAKSAVSEIDPFVSSFYLERPKTNYAAITIVPHRLFPSDHDQLAKKHGHILDRLRTPIAALRGFELATFKRAEVDGYMAVSTISKWLIYYRRPRLTS